VKGVKKCCLSNALDENNDNMLCNVTVKRMGMLGVSVREMKALTVKWRL
jgi:hypothetical protein